MMSQEQLERWRLILGKDSQDSLAALSPSGCALSAEQLEMDEALEAIYVSESERDISRSEWESPTEGRPHGTAKGRSTPRVARWLDQIRNFFPKDVVVLLQQDAIERRGLKELLFEPEILAQVEPSLDLASMVLELKNLVPEKAKDAARELVRRVVEELRKRLETSFARPCGARSTVASIRRFAACPTSTIRGRSAVILRTITRRSKRSFPRKSRSSAVAIGRMNGM